MECINCGFGGVYDHVDMWHGHSVVPVCDNCFDRYVCHFCARAQFDDNWLVIDKLCPDCAVEIGYEQCWQCRKWIKDYVTDTEDTTLCRNCVTGAECEHCHRYGILLHHHSGGFEPYRWCDDCYDLLVCPECDEIKATDMSLCNDCLEDNDE